MNGAHWHLIVNHLPIIFPIVGIIVMIIGIVSKSEPIKRTAYLIFVLSALTAVAGMITGEKAEEVVEKMNGVTEKYIERHEEMAEIFTILTYILGGFSILGLWASFKEKAYSFSISVISLPISIVVLFLAKQTGTTGGEIRHTEIRNIKYIPVENTTDEKDK